MDGAAVGLRLGEKGALFAAVDDGSATECRQAGDRVQELGELVTAVWGSACVMSAI